MPTVPPKSFEHNPIFTVSAFLGLFPFEKGPTFGLDKLLFVYSFVFAAAVTLIGGLSMLDDLTPLLTESYNQAIILAYIGGLILVFPCSLTCAFLKRDVLQQTFRALKEIQSTFEKIRLSKFNKLTHLLPLFDISVPLLCTLLTYVTNSNIPGTAYGTFNGLTLMGMALICGQLSFLVDLIGDIFDAGIDFLNEMKLSLIIKRHSKRISELVKATNKLGSASCSLNEVYSDQILVMMSLCFCGFSIHLYYISMLASLPDGFKFDLLLPQVYSVLFYCYVSWRVNQSSAETSGKNKLRLHISMKREVVFTACGFFNLDYTLVHSMIASATTYLVILIQFGKPETVDQQPPASTAMTNFTTSQLYL
ncbi:unnamed protein product [Nezara viridula]|uniref:Gustatory receptor n=1 Tax=Nezara viridula TaxID=85310 RepID=A0A9P0EIC3_NEZVI|nr:unnamed protein product [Nezara viridula]